jgi:hypothetical protein
MLDLLSFGTIVMNPKTKFGVNLTLSMEDVFDYFMPSGSNISTISIRRELHEMGFLGRAAAHEPKNTMHKCQALAGVVLAWCGRT